MEGQVVEVVGGEDSSDRVGKAGAWEEASKWVGSGKSWWRRGREVEGDGGGERLEGGVLVVEEPSVILAPSWPWWGNT